METNTDYNETSSYYAVFGKAVLGIISLLMAIATLMSIIELMGGAEDGAE